MTAPVPVAMPDDHARPPGAVVPPDAAPGHAHALAAEVAALAAALAPHLPARPACAALWRLPPLAALAAYHAVRAAGLVPVLLNDRWTAADAAAALRVVPCAVLLRGDGDVAADADADADADEDADAGEHGFACTVVRVRRDDTPFPPVYAAERAPRTAPQPTTQPVSVFADGPPAAVFFTSGTTSAPKAVPLTDAQLHLQSAAKRAALGLSRATRYLHLGPLFHVGGFSAAHATTAVAGTHVFAPRAARLSRAAAARSVLAAARDARVTFVSAVPAALRLLLDAAAAGERDGDAQMRLRLPAVQTVLYGAGPLAPVGAGDVSAAGPDHADEAADGTDAVAASTTAVCAVLDELRALFPRAAVVGAYGMTETASSMTFVHHALLPRGSALHASAGWAQRGTGVEVRVRGGGDGGGCGPGEIETRGEHLMRGYVGRDAVAPRSWWRTGDIGRIDAASGALFVLGRLHDVIRCGGEKVLAAEVEAALVCAAGVRDAAVVGVPHRVLGEAVAAAVVLASGAADDENGDNNENENSNELAVSEVVAQACAGLARYKRPRWAFAERSLPRNASGKVVKRELRARLQRRIVVSAPTAKL